MPGTASLEVLREAIADFAVVDLDLVTEPAALAAAQRSLDESGLLLLGEMHGVRGNPLVILTLMRALGIKSLALEWFDGLAPVIKAFLATATLVDNEALWWGMAVSPLGTWQYWRSVSQLGH